MGIDPGTTRLGLAWNEQGKIWLAEVYLQRPKDPVERMCALHGFLSGLGPYPLHGNPFPRSTVIEGAAFGERYRQVELAEARAIIAWWAKDFGPTKIVNPISIRKGVFGTVKVRAHDYWDNNEVENDALAALSCLYYAATLEVKGEKSSS